MREWYALIYIFYVYVAAVTRVRSLFLVSLTQITHQSTEPYI